MNVLVLLLGVFHFASPVQIEVVKPSTELPTTTTTVAETSTLSTVNSTETTTTTTTQVTTVQISTTAPKSTTTPKPTKAPKAKNSTTINPSMTFLNRRADNKVSNYYCKCDFLVNMCEINCCCDLDCSKDTVKLFDCSAEEFTQLEFDYTGKLQSCDISGGLLCISSSNVKEQAKNVSFLKKKNFL